ncbi:MAG: hypothetical protein KIT58_03090 [Planctomycetota bacterium]|nr:hypothetical protein [Planctomycetota bacterium]
MPTLMRRLAVIRRVDARRRRDALCERLAAARGGEDAVRQLLDALGEQAGEGTAAGGIEDLMRALGGG